MAGLFDIFNADSQYYNEALNTISNLTNNSRLFNLVNTNSRSDTYASMRENELIKKYNQLNANASNIEQSPAYLQNVNKITPFEGDNLRGYFKSSAPNEINVSVSAPNPLKTTGHEAYHAQKNDYSEFLKETGTKNTSKFQHANPYSWDILPPLYGERDIYTFQKRIKEVYNKYSDKYSLGGEFSYNPEETMADLQGIEASLPSGKTLLDTDIGKDLYKTKEEKQYYLKASLPGVTKALEHDPSLWEIATDRADYALRVFKDKALSSSYAKAATEAFKAFIKNREQ